MRSQPLTPHHTEVKSLFDYRQEAYLLALTFDTLEDFQAIDPTKYGFNQDFVKSITLP
jgi:hypothetical protein